MNTSQPSTTTEVPMTRAAKEELLRKLYSLAHWIELVRLIGYQAIPMEKAREAIRPLADRFGKEPVAVACEALVEIVTPDKEPIARLKSHVRRMAFQILGPEPARIETPVETPPAPPPEKEIERKRRSPAEPEKKKRARQEVAEKTTSVATGSSGTLMEQYRAAKEKHPNMLLLFRVGDFYELFEQDAETAHKLLGLTLTTRDQTLTMAGFPHHQLEAYLNKLLQQGQRVAICEPAEDSVASGPIRREVTRVVTPGVAEDEEPGKPEGKPVRQPRHFVLKKFEAWMKEQGLAFVSVDEVQRTTPAVAAYVGVLDFIMLRGEEKLLVTVRPNVLAKHLVAMRHLLKLFGNSYRPIRIWPCDEVPWTWPEFAVMDVA